MADEQAVGVACGADLPSRRIAAGVVNGARLVRKSESPRYVPSATGSTSAIRAACHARRRSSSAGSSQIAYDAK